MILGGDIDLPLDPRYSALRSLYAWNDAFLLGFDQSQGAVAVSPLLFFDLFLSYLGVSMGVVERILFFLGLLLPAMSMYYAMVALLNVSRTASLVGALAYTYNPLTLVAWHGGGYLMFLGYGILPLVLVLLVRGLNSSSFRYDLCAEIALLTSLMSIGAQIPMLFTSALLAVLYLCYYILRFRKLRRATFAIAFCSVSLLLVIVMNLWWMMPVANQALVYRATFTRIMAFSALSSGMFDVLRELGYWGWYEYFGFAGLYNAIPLLLIATFVAPFLAWLPMIGLPRRKGVVVLSALAVLGVFLAKGVTEPLGQIYDWAFHNVPYFWIYRDAWTWFIPIVILAYAPLSGISIDCIARGLSGVAERSEHIRLRHIVAAALVVLLLVPAWPIFTGHVTERLVVSNGVPGYYTELGHEFGSAEYGLFLLPPTSLELNGVEYDWGYRGPEIMPQVLNVSMVRSFAYNARTAEFIGLALNMSEQNRGDQFVRMLGMLNMGYILLQYDVNTDIYGGPSAHFYKRLLDSQPNVTLAKNLDRILLYRNAWANGWIYPASSVVYIDGGLNSFSEFMSADKYRSGMLFFFSDELTAAQRKAVLANANAIVDSSGSLSATLDANQRRNQLFPRVTWTKLNPTKYTIETWSNTPFYLVFTQSFSSEWRILDNGNTLYPIPANYFAMSYLISSGHRTMTLEYAPQHLVVAGFILSALGIVVCFVLVAARRRQEKA
jgi:hypothetical protein